MNESDPMARQASDKSGDSDAIAHYIYEVGYLKDTPRTGWTLAGVKDPESVADHSFRTAIIGVILAWLEGADPARTALLCLFHDTVETRVGDIPSVGKRYLRDAEDEVVVDQTEALPRDMAMRIVELVRDYKDAAGVEARLAKDADKLECLAQARQYADAGVTQARYWVDGLAEGVESTSGSNLANAMRTASPDAWWRQFVELYRGSADDVANVRGAQSAPKSDSP